MIKRHNDWFGTGGGTLTRSRPALPDMPQLGRSEGHYDRLAREAQEQDNPPARAAAKVGQYLTLARNPSLRWEAKLRFYRHALDRHCVPPQFPEEDVWMFYQQLADLVRHTAGAEALSIASIADDAYAQRLQFGQHHASITEDAEQLFDRLAKGETCPSWFNREDWEQLILIRNQWI